MNFKLLKTLSESFGVSGFEDEVRDFIKGEIKGYVDEMTVDPIGNLIARKKGKGRNPLKVMVSAHIDEIGFLVKHIDENGFLRLDKLGGVQIPLQLGRQVTVQGKQKLSGVIGARSISALSDEEKKKSPEIDELFVDLGMPAKQVRENVEIGTPLSLRMECLRFGNLVSGKAMDDRIGVYCMMEVLKKLRNNAFDVYFVGTVQEEVGLRGAKTSAYRIKPDIGIALDVTHAGDVPNIPAHKRVVGLGGGAAIKIKDAASLCSPKLVKIMRRISEENKIPHQLEVLPSGGTDGGAMQMNMSGNHSITISVPTRYVHSPVESCHVDDVQAVIDLLWHFLEHGHSEVSKSL